MGISSWVLIIAMSEGAPLPERIAVHKQFNTYTECAMYRDKFIQHTHMKNNRDIRYPQSLDTACVPGRKKYK